MRRKASVQIVDLPALKYRMNGKSKWQTDPALLLMAGIGMDLVRNYVESWVFNKEDMFVFLSRHVANGKRAQVRSNTLFGRFLNWGTGYNPYNIAVSGPYLRPILKLMEVDGSGNVIREGEYWLRLDIAETILDALSNEIPHRKPLG